jgi:L-ascorbate metabolism protein UlaG (beta-lactamase superfamily)
MTQNSLRIAPAIVILLCAVFGYSGDVPPELHVTALGNEGFLVEVGSSTVIVDGLYRGLRGYVAPTEQQLRARERAEPPFDVMDLVLATHHHPDHFDAKVVASHLKSNPRAVIVTTPMAVELIRGNAEQFRSISKRVRAVFPAEGETEDVEIDTAFFTSATPWRRPRSSSPSGSPIGKSTSPLYPFGICWMHPAPRNIS